MNDIAQQLRAMKFTDAQIAAATCHGKPLSEAKKPHRLDRYRSKTERQYSMVLEDKIADKFVARFEYEALTFTLAPCSELGGRAARFTPDFCVWLRSGKLELHEVKGGFVREAARVRFLVAKRLYPEFTWRMIQKQRNGWWIDIF